MLLAYSYHDPDDMAQLFQCLLFGPTCVRDASWQRTVCAELKRVKAAAVAATATRSSRDRQRAQKGRQEVAAGRTRKVGGARGKSGAGREGERVGGDAGGLIGAVEPGDGDEDEQRGARAARRPRRSAGNGLARGVPFSDEEDVEDEDCSADDDYSDEEAAAGRRRRRQLSSARGSGAGDIVEARRRADTSLEGSARVSAASTKEGPQRGGRVCEIVGLGRGGATGGVPRVLLRVEQLHQAVVELQKSHHIEEDDDQEEVKRRHVYQLAPVLTTSFSPPPSCHLPLTTSLLPPASRHLPLAASLLPPPSHHDNSTILYRRRRTPHGQPQRASLLDRYSRHSCPRLHRLP